MLPSERTFLMEFTFHLNAQSTYGDMITYVFARQQCPDSNWSENISTFWLSGTSVGTTLFSVIFQFTSLINTRNATQYVKFLFTARLTDKFVTHIFSLLNTTKSLEKKSPLKFNLKSLWNATILGTASVSHFTML